MEAGWYFSVFVLSMCAMHLIATASDRLEDWRRKRGPRHNAVGRTGRKPQADDWYVFFHCDDLTGSEAGDRKSTHPAAGRAQDRKDSRPRMNAR